VTYHLMDPLGEVGSRTHCPGCGSSHTVWVSTGVQDNVLCRTCGTCWHETGRHAQRVSVAACTGCDHREVCLAAQG
jgi:hypothetical protein